MYHVISLCTIAILLIAVLLLAVKIQQVHKKNKILTLKCEKQNEINQRKNDFLTHMSHEIRTPMNGVIGMATLAKRCEADTKKVDNYLDKILNSTKILLNLINDILDMSAIEQDKLTLAAQEFDFKDLLSAVSTFYYTRCKEKGIKFDFLIDGNVDEVLIGDPLRVNQILLNVLSNAYKNTDKSGSIKVVVSEVKRENSLSCIKFMISDTGHGMTPEMKERLFAAYEYETNQYGEGNRGTGLGMTITKRLIELMHGTINVKSELEKGTSFYIEIPFEVAENYKKVDPTQFAKVRALVVDDDIDTIEYTSTVLQRIGIRFDVANNGGQALAMVQNAYAQSDGYDICFVDWKMPNMNGIDVTAKIRELFDEDTIIIIVSSYELSEIQEEAKMAGANMFVPKPLFQSTVFNLLMSLGGGKYEKLHHAPSNYDFQGKRVLLAEDAVFNAEVAIDLLKEVNIEVVLAENGQEAVNKFTLGKPGAFAAILMDIQMPVMDGYEATRIIRRSKHPEAKTIPIYAMTANAFTEDIAEAIANGMNGHIAKPIDVDILYRTLWHGIFGRQED